MTTRVKDVVGRHGEDLAVRVLQDEGLTILDRNWRCDLGEVDVVARDGDTVVICEVKTRRSMAQGGPLEAVTEQKLARLRRLAARWLLEHADSVPSVRIDVLAVYAPPGRPPRVRHLSGVA